MNALKQQILKAMMGMRRTAPKLVSRKAAFTVGAVGGSVAGYRTARFLHRQATAYALPLRESK